MIDNVKVDLPQALLQVVLLLLQLLDSLLVAQLNPGWYFFLKMILNQVTL